MRIPFRTYPKLVTQVSQVCGFDKMRGGFCGARIIGVALTAVSLSGPASFAQTVTPDTGPTGIDMIPTDLPAHASSVQQDSGPMSLLPGTIPADTRIREKNEIPSLADQYQRTITGQQPIRPVRQNSPKPLPSSRSAPGIPAPTNTHRRAQPVSDEQNATPANPVETALPASAATRATNDYFLIQLGAFRDRFSAETYWASFRIRYPELSKSYEKKIVLVDLGNQGMYHRLQLAGFEDSDSAQKQCRTLKADGTDCFATDR
jgi:cell division septation protein DedD